ncbi:MAG: hypothetical protein P9L99_14520 [Candidatus Lernaella stagnicola]|nr:hypothetical protein [Candidatus Lernaella stagnicola]
MFRSLFVLTLALLLVAGLACDDDDDDNDTPADDDDNDDASPVGTWPDDPKPLNGWLATHPRESSEWSALYRIEIDDVTTYAIPDSGVFEFGDALGPVAWATDMTTLYQFSIGEWREFSMQPPCATGEGTRILKNFLFSEDSGVVHCFSSETLVKWNGSSWSDWREDVAALIDCMPSGECVALLNNEHYVVISSADEEELTFDRALYDLQMQTAQVIYGFASSLNGGSEEFVLVRCENTVCEEDSRGIRVLTTGENPVLARIDNDHMAVSGFQLDTLDLGVFVLAGANELIETNWPYFRWMTFAPGGSGLGISPVENDAGLYLISGLQAARLIEFSNEEHITGFLVAADAY